MKTLLLSSFVIVFAGLCNSFAQTPQAIPYQAVARNAVGVPLASQNIAVRFSIRDSIITGTIVYRETHTVVTNSLGLFNLNVGKGTPVSGASFANINWGKNAKFMQVEMDPAGGSAFVDLGTQQMMSVPYALFTQNVGNGFTNFQVFDQVGTFSWTAPANVQKVKVECWGGGAGGVFFYYSPNQLNQRRLNGASGAYGCGIFSVSPETTYSVIVGSGGVGYNGAWPTVTNSLSQLSEAFGGASSFQNFIISEGGSYEIPENSTIGSLVGKAGTSNGAINIQGKLGTEANGVGVDSQGGDGPNGGQGGQGLSPEGNVPGGGGVSNFNGGHGRVIIWW